MSKILRDSRVPIYQQLYDVLHSKIVGGEWEPGDLLPPESELIGQYEVSRVTARQALDMLVQEGLIYRERGRGTFVAHPTVEQGLTRIINFTQDMLQRGFRAGTRVLSARLVAASEEVAGKLSLEPGEELVCIERLRLADDEPMSVEEAYFVHRYCPGILDQDFTSRSLRELMDRFYNIRWLRAKQSIRAIAAPRELAQVLSVRPNSPLLSIERVSYSQQDIPIEFLRLYHRGDRYVLYNELRG